ncbi:C-type lectin domain family 4 member K [Echinops telfairi]|uniref:C-type lectin domain family 4 member K n=1 Tax=Echinops telfairi TaxID=9371 RepID=A0ABM0IXU3_ECHTE|nr:C-type lectin domain family 4 member K [Echinops telfairi]
MTSLEEPPCVHFSVDKQNISLWPREPPPKNAWLLGTLSDIKTSGELLTGRVDNISTEGLDIQKNRGGLKAASVQIQRVNVSLQHVRSQFLALETGLQRADARIQMLTRSWQDVSALNAQIPELKRDLDNAGVFKAKIQGLQSSLERLDQLLRQQRDILQMVSQDWKYFNGSYYYFSYTPKTWYSAQQYCLSRDSHLTSVTSEQEQEFLYKTAGERVYWIGLTKTGSDRDWVWADGTPFSKAQSARFWIPGEPNNAGNNEHCAYLKRASLQAWNDGSCDIQFLFICRQPYIPSEL